MISLKDNKLTNMKIFYFFLFPTKDVFIFNYNHFTYNHVINMEKGINKIKINYDSIYLRSLCETKRKMFLSLYNSKLYFLFLKQLSLSPTNFLF